MSDRVVRISVLDRGKLVIRDAMVIPEDREIERLSLPLRIGRRNVEVLVEFDPSEKA